MDRYLDQFAEDQINFGFGDILDQLNADAEHNDEYPDLDYDEPWDSILEQQELEDFEQCDEHFFHFGSNDEW